jgi:hypothetical protein
MDDAAFEAFTEEYRDRVSDALRTGYKNFSSRLSDWLDLIDQSEVLATAARTLEEGFDFDA